MCQTGRTESSFPLELSFQNITTNSYQLRIITELFNYTIKKTSHRHVIKIFWIIFIPFSLCFFIHYQKRNHFANCPCAPPHCSRKIPCCICTNFCFLDTTWHPCTRLSRWTKGRWSRTKWSSSRTRGWSAWSTRGRVGCTQTRRGSMKTRRPRGNWCTRYSKVLNKLGRSNGSWSTLPLTRQKRRKFL